MGGQRQTKWTPALTTVQLHVLLQVLLKVEGLPTGGLRAAEGLLVNVLVLLVVLRRKGWQGRRARRMTAFLRETDRAEGQAGTSATSRTTALSRPGHATYPRLHQEQRHIHPTPTTLLCPTHPILTWTPTWSSLQRDAPQWPCTKAPQWPRDTPAHLPQTHCWRGEWSR